MDWRYKILLLTVVVSSVKCVQDLEELRYLKELYRLNTNKGCGTEIKCDIPENISQYLSHSNYKDVRNMPLLGNSTHGGYKCCYDCSRSCEDGQRCYESWQCCGQNDLETEEDGINNKYDYLEEFVACEPSFLFHRYNQNESHPDTERIPVSYNMISKCPEDYQDLETIQKCKAPATMSPILERIPYISKTTTYVYRNIHCVLCHNLSHKEIVPFSLSVHEWRSFSINELSIISQFETVKDMVQFNTANVFIDNDKIDYVIVRTLPELMSKYPKTIKLPKQCNIDDILLSSVEANGNVPDIILSSVEASGNVPGIRIRTCLMFDFPIYVHKLYSEGEAFKNLACAFLNIPTYSLLTTTDRMGSPLPACTFEDTQGPRLVLNTHPALAHTLSLYTLSKKQTTVETPDNISKHFNNKGDADSHLDMKLLTPDGRSLCSNGFFMDTHRKRCRKILCPHRFYIYKGRCEPIYLETVRYSYFTLVKVSPKYKETTIKRHTVQSILDKTKIIISKLTGMNICGHLTFAKVRGRNFIYVVLAIWLTPRSDREQYRDIINRIRSIFKDDLYHLDDDDDTLDDLTISLASEAMTEPAWRNMYAGDTFAKTTLKQIPTRNTEAPYPMRQCSPALWVTTLVYCLRVKLHASEYSFINDTLRFPATIVLIATGQTIYNNEYEQMVDGYISICISSYLQLNKPNSIKKPVTWYLKVPTDKIDIYIIIGLGFLCVIVIAALVYCRIK